MKSPVNINFTCSTAVKSAKKVSVPHPRQSSTLDELKRTSCTYPTEAKNWLPESNNRPEEATSSQGTPDAGEMTCSQLLLSQLMPSRFTWSPGTPPPRPT